MAVRERTPRIACLLLLCLLALWPAWAQGPADVAEVTGKRSFDPAYTRFGFELRTRWGQRVSGVFPQYEGEVSTLADGRHRVRIVLRTAEVIVAGSDRYTALARGPSFFDAQRYPYIEFVSDPHPDTLIQTGGRMRGRLSMHGVTRMETFYLSDANCERPGTDCDVLASGSISRDDYGLDGWQFALVDRVRFMLRVRLVEATTP
ncbi:YceI family protein [Lysobacter sp. FW306-1B-D06B]|uniref:YceI family protein n=1 Tax=Lysobacter sp. FW306-1B-D06B TaxID=3140250 RepID=UPI003140AB8F